MENMVRDAQYFMRLALDEAGQALNEGEVPVGAVITRNGEIITSAHNMREQQSDPTSHAEILAVREACRELGSWRLDGCDLYVTLEPCAMCAGALIHSRIRTLYFGAYDPKAGAAGSVIDILSVKHFNHSVTVIGGILEDDCSAMISGFFRKLR